MARQVAASTSFLTVAKNDKYLAVLQKGSVELRPLSYKASAGADSLVSVPKTYPESRDKPADITCVALTPHFFVYGGRSGAIYFYYLDDQGPLLVNEFTHDTGILRFWSNNLGTRIIFEDDKLDIHLYNPLNDQTIRIPDFNGTLEAVIWDASDKHILVLIESCQNYVYLYSPVSIYCSRIVLLGVASRADGLCPTILQNGILTCKCENGAEDIILSTHSWLHTAPKGSEQIRGRFDQNIALHHLQEAWNDAMILNTAEVWNAFIMKALEQMELETVMKACQQSKNVKMLTYLQLIEDIEDCNLLAGHILLLLGKHDDAEVSFLKSSYPEAALQMRKDLRQWEKAYSLAVQLGSTSTNDVKLQYALLLERQGDYRQALTYFEELLKSDSWDSRKYFLIQAAVARSSLHSGDLWKAKQIAMEYNDAVLYCECAKILEGFNLLKDAAEFYDLGGQLQKATLHYIHTKNYSKAFSLLERITIPRLYIEYAKAMESEKKFSDAALAYESAEDIENFVRLQLGPLQDPMKAFSVLRKTKSIGGAVIAAKFCKNNGDYENAIEFLIMAKRTEEAKELAKQQSRMDAYTEFVIDVACKEECLELARYYETMGSYEKAANLLEHCDEPSKALILYLRLGTEAAIEKAIDLVKREGSDSLVSQLLKYLSGETEGSARNSYYLCKLHVALGDDDAATKEILLYSSKEQENGNYKKGHEGLQEFCSMLQSQGKEVPAEILNKLMLLHSYILAKMHIHLENHTESAQLLIRVARKISDFPSHIVPILTSTVIECQYSGLKKTAFEFASMLMRPEYRNLISPVYKRQVERIVRKSERAEEEEPLSPCPICLLPIPEMQLECTGCNSNLPFCIVTGRHMVLGNWSVCPNCKFPALTTEFIKMTKAILSTSTLETTKTH